MKTPTNSAVANKEEKQKTRPDLDDEHYLAFLSNQKENAGIDVYGLYRSMLEWCGKTRKTPSRLRLLNWLNTERSAVPMTALPTFPKPEPLADPEYVPPPPCDICGKEICFSLHREERGI